MNPAAAAKLARAANRLDRRAFLRLAAAASAAGLLPTGCGGVPSRFAPSPDKILAVLSARGYATFAAAATRVVGPAGEEMITAGRIDVAATADAWLARTPALAAPITQALVVLEFGVWPLVAKVEPFSTLSAAKRDAVLANLMRSRFELKRALFQGVRALSLLSFYTNPASRELSRYLGPFGNAETSIHAGMQA